MSSTGGDPSIIDWLSLAVDALVPLSVAAVGFLLKKYVDGLERQREMLAVSQQWRIELARDLLHQLNVLNQFFTYVGEWRELTSDAATVAKREIDRHIYTNEFLWSEGTLAAWRQYKEGCFIENCGRDSSFKFKANIERHKERSNWTDAEDVRFVAPDTRTRRAEFRKLNGDLLECLSRDLGIVKG